MAVRQARPLHVSELLGNGRVPLVRAIDDHRNQESLLFGHVPRTVHREGPLPAEIAFVAVLRVDGDQWNEQPAVVDSVLDLAIPDIATPQLGSVEPHFDADRAQCRGDSLGGSSVLRGIAEKYPSRWLLRGRCRSV